MKCPFCNNDKTMVFATSAPWNKSHDSYKRYRRCLNCGETFATVEEYLKDYSKPRAFIRRR